MMFAGLWEYWKPREGDPVTSYTIIVCAPNPLAAGVHDRMPVIISEDDWDRWLAAGSDDAAQLLKPCPEEMLQRYPVATSVNSPKNDSPQLVEPIGAVELSECPPLPIKT